MNIVGIDIGGTGIKAALVDSNGKILKKSSIPTLATRSANLIVADIAKQIDELTRGEQYEGIGIGCPGAIDSKNGVVIYSNNLYWRDVKLIKELKTFNDKPTKISNDANVAALGEARFGAGRDYSDMILVTLGTGVGGGIIINNQIYEGYGSMGAELGHAVIRAGGVACTCGRKGCLEAYASATALIRETVFAMQTDFNSLMWKFVGGNLSAVDGRTSFECAKQGDKTAKAVVDAYIDNLADGIVNFINIFRTQAIVVGGGVCAQGDYLTKPLQQLVDQRRYGGADSPYTIIKTAMLGNDAGVIGAAGLLL